MVIGLDGCSWNVLEPLLDTGRLPHLAALRDTGASGVLESTIPFYTGPAWASYATGASPAAHGIYDFMMLRPDGTLTVARQADMLRPTYYHQLGKEGHRSVLVNLPIDQHGSENAVIVNSWLTVDERRRLYPVETRERYRALLDAYRNYPTTFDAPLAQHLRDLCELEQARFDLARALFLAEDWDHFFCLFSSTDWLGHKATGAFLRGDADARAAFLTLYEQLDAAIGWVLEHSGDATVVVMSDHGQCAEEHVVRVNALLRELGYVRLVREGTAEGPRLRVPEALRPFAAAPGARRAVRAARRRLRAGGVDLVTPREGRDADRRESRAMTPTVASYAVHVHDCTPEDEERIVGALEALRLDDGRPAFDGVWPAADLYGRELAPGAPAIVFAPAVGVRPSISTTPPLVERAADPGRGAHQRDGILLVHGPDVVVGDLGRASIYDVAPTLLWLMDAALPTGADGRPLLELFRADEGGPRLPREAEWDVAAGAPAADAESDEVARRLAALGYL